MEQWELGLERELCELLMGLNSGAWPTNAEEWQAVLMRLGCRGVIWSGALERGDSFLRRGVLYLSDRGVRDCVWCHEAVELCLMSWEGCAPYVVPVGCVMSEVRHRLAGRVCRTSNSARFLRGAYGFS